MDKNEISEAIGTIESFLELDTTVYKSLNSILDKLAKNSVGYDDLCRKINNLKKIIRLCKPINPLYAAYVSLLKIMIEEADEDSQWLTYIANQEWHV